MNLWVDNINDVRFSVNDVYMTLLMTGWMFLFMGFFNKELYIFLIGLFLVIANVYFIRSQFLVTEYQYKLGMIPHHSMAIHMSKKLLEKENNIAPFLENLIILQENEINFLKTYSTISES
jgi:hypothetical protein